MRREGHPGQQVHQIKCLRSTFDLSRDNVKLFEVRRNDRDYAVGDIVEMFEWLPTDGYTGRFLRGSIVAILQGRYGLPDEVCVFQVSHWHLEQGWPER